VTRRVVYAASGTGPYNFTFEILAATDIAVYRDDTLLTLTTNYTVTINSNGTGYITLTASPTGATQIAIVGNRSIQRTTDFVTGGDFFANTVNDELDQQTIFAQQNAEGLQRALQAPQTDPTSINMTLPGKVARAGKYLAFDSNGNPTPGPTSTAVDAVAVIADEITTVAGISTKVVTVAGQSAQINTLAPISASITTVAGISTSVVTVAALNSAQLTAIAGATANMAVLAPITTQITNVSNISAQVVQVAALSSASLNAVAGQTANIAALGAISPQITTVASQSTQINTVAGQSTQIGLLALQTADLAALGPISANITTVATNIGAVQSASVNALTAQAAATSASISALSATNSATSASASATSAAASYDSFDDRYLGAKSSAPSVDNDGAALMTGALYWNSTSSLLFIWTGSAWDQAAFSVSGAVSSFNTRTGAVTLSSTDVINALSLTATVSELNYSSGVTSSIQTQLNTKASTGKAIAMAIVFGG
jgi:hypothetical protein